MELTSRQLTHLTTWSATSRIAVARRHWLKCGYAMVVFLLASSTVWTAVNVGEICRVKGQDAIPCREWDWLSVSKEQVTVTLAPTALSLIQIMNNMGIPLTNGSPQAAIDLQDAKNVALVVVTAEVPEQGGRQGDEFNCTVSAVNAKSLKGGILLMTPMLGPVPPGERPENALVYAFARGPVQLDDNDNPTTAKITVGCRMEENFMNPFVKDDKITLVLNRSHARFEVAEEVAFQINNDPEFGGGADESRQQIAQPIDQLSIEIAIPVAYRSKPVEFAARVLEVRLPVIPSIETVVVNETTGVISMSADLEIAPQALQHQNMVIEISNGALASEFVELI